MLSRRRFVAGSAAALAVLASPRDGRAQGSLVTKRTRLVMLATGGGPRPRRDRGNTAHALVVDNVLHLVDCGSGVARQLVVAGIPLATLRHVFITHHHSDHNL
ncbi:MAG: MBL fold metallo-hydrolase, partial [Candidatus Rokuibacteriota bacterium]